MSGRLWLVGGFAVGYVLGTRAGRARYEQISNAVRRVAEDPAVAGALEIVQDRAERLYTNGRAAVTDKIGAIRAADEPQDEFATVAL